MAVPGGHDPSRTMLGDSAVAVHPEDERYRDLIGRMVILPLMNREIPIVADEYVDREFGTGALKITPAHDLNDFEIGKKHGLDSSISSTISGNINENGGSYEGLERYAARDRVVRDLKSRGCWKKSMPMPMPSATATAAKPLSSLTEPAVVCQGRASGRGGDRGGQQVRHENCSATLGKNLFRMDEQHPGLVYQPSDLVGP